VVVVVVESVIETKVVDGPAVHEVPGVVTEEMIGQAEVMTTGEEVATVDEETTVAIKIMRTVGVIRRDEITTETTTETIPGVLKRTVQLQAIVKGHLLDSKLPKVQKQ